jgi:hypothetical protein
LNAIKYGFNDEFCEKSAGSPIKYSTICYIFDSDYSAKTVTQLRETARYKTQQAVIECGSDAKTGERRG